MRSIATRRYLVGLTITALCTATPFSANAQTQGSHELEHDAEHEHEHEGLHFSHPMVTESVSPDTKLRFDFGQGFETDATETEFELEGEYAFSRSFSIEAGAPVASVNPDIGATETGLGNISVAFKFANFAFEEDGILLGYGIEFGLPTGSDNKGIGSAHILDIEPFFNIGFKREAWELVAFTRYGIPTRQNAGEEIETEFAYDASLLYHVSERVQTLLELNGVMGLSGDASGQGVAAISPGFKLVPFPHRPFIVGLSASIPINNDALDTQYRVSFFRHF